MDPTRHRCVFFAVCVMQALWFINVHAQTTLVDEDWENPALSSGTALTNGMFTGWTVSGGASIKTLLEGTDGIPGDDAAGTAQNQVINFDYTTYYLEYDISHNWASNETYYLRIDASPRAWGGANQRYIRPELRQQDGTLLWSTSEDSTTAVPLYDSFVSLTNYTSDLMFWFTIEANSFLGGTEGQPISLRIVTSGQRGLGVNNVTLTLGPLPADSTAPEPDAMTWEDVPTVSDFINVSMTASSARDPGDLYDVEYMFTNTVRNTSSGWQEGRTWSETNLDYGTTYTYKVKARDKSPNQNETALSAGADATTEAQDLTPPTPDPLTWSVAPTGGDYGYITMTVNAASDVASGGVEYLFTNTVRGTSSGWQTSATWNEGGLEHDTTYAYKVKARDISPAQNESTTWSTEESATTWSVPVGTLVIFGFQCPDFGNNIGIVNESFVGWTAYSGPKVYEGGNNGMPHDTDYPSANQGIHFENINDYMEYDISHNWAAHDVYSLTINAAPQATWNYDKQRYVRPSIREQDGTVLWAPGENMAGDEKTALPTNIDFDSSNWQAQADLNFTFTIAASDFVGVSGAAAGQPIAVRIASSGVERGIHIDNVSLTLVLPPAGSAFRFR